MPPAPPKSTGYRVGKPRGTCFLTGHRIEPGEPYVGVLREVDGGYERLDATPQAWAAAEDQSAVATWQGTMPAEDVKPEDKLAVDDDVLATLLMRLAGDAEPEKVAFRFVIGLMLMRSRRLAFLDEATDEEGRDIWTMRFRGGDREYVNLIDPKLDAAELEAASDRVSRMLTEGVDREEIDASGQREDAGEEDE